MACSFHIVQFYKSPFFYPEYLFREQLWALHVDHGKILTSFPFLHISYSLIRTFHVLFIKFVVLCKGLCNSTFCRHFQFKPKTILTYLKRNCQNLQCSNIGSRSAGSSSLGSRTPLDSTLCGFAMICERIPRPIPVLDKKRKKPQKKKSKKIEIEKYFEKNLICRQKDSPLE